MASKKFRRHRENSVSLLAPPINCKAGERQERFYDDLDMKKARCPTRVFHYLTIILTDIPLTFK